MVSETDKAYIAGFIDGEGSIFATRSQRSISFRLTVTQKHRTVLDFIYDKYGGKFTLQSKNSGCWILAWYGRDAIQKVLLDLRPYIIEKRPQTDLVLEFFDTASCTNYRLDNVERQRRLTLADNLRVLNGGGRKYVVKGWKNHLSI